MPDLAPIVETTIASHRATLAGRALLVGITGIDGSGKGYVTEQLVEQLRAAGLNVAAINVDGWLELPSRRFDPRRPAEHFYERGIRFGEMFERLVLPLRDGRSIRVDAELADATGTEVLHKHTYEFHDIYVIVLEGMFLLKRLQAAYFDLSFWIDCTFETALERALARNQEGLSPDAIVHDYETIYFPAQRIHFERDAPREAASAIVVNDPRIA